MLPPTVYSSRMWILIYNEIHHYYSNSGYSLPILPYPKYSSGNPSGILDGTNLLLMEAMVEKLLII